MVHLEIMVCLPTVYPGSNAAAATLVMMRVAVAFVGMAMDLFPILETAFKEERCGPPCFDMGCGMLKNLCMWKSQQRLRLVGTG